MRYDKDMKEYEKTGYLQEPFRLFHLRDNAVGEVSLHYHDFYKLIVFYHGNVTYMIEGKSYLLEPGDIVIVNRYDIHKPTIDPAVTYERSILYISQECLESCRADGYDPFFCFTQAAEQKAYVLRLGELAGTKAGRLLSELEERPQRYGRAVEESLLFRLFLLEVNRICMEGEAARAVRPGAIYNRKMIDLLTYLGEHLFEDISIDDLAETFYISKYHMMRQFKHETGYTIHRYMTEKRIAAAKEKLLSGVPAAKAGEECGFQDYSTFLRAFQSCVHMTPTAFVEDRRARSLGAGRNLL